MRQDLLRGRKGFVCLSSFLARDKFMVCQFQYDAPLCMYMMGVIFMAASFNFWNRFDVKS